MWPTHSLWGNALLFAAVGYGLVLSAALGSVLGRSSAGRRALNAAPLALACLILVYVGVSLVFDNHALTEEGCLYDSTHPSSC